MQKKRNKSNRKGAEPSRVELQAAQRFVRKLGGVDQARLALSTLVRIRRAA